MLGIGILLALVLVIVFAAIQQTRDENQIPYTSISSQPNGTLALRLWLNELGFRSAETRSSSFEPGPGIDIIFMIQPSYSVTPDEWRILDRWIEEGGVLILAGKNGVTDLAMQHFDFDISLLSAQAAEIAPALPLLKSPILESKVALKTDFGIRTDRSDFTPLMTAGDRPVALIFPQEKGRVILSTTPEAFTNLGLKDETAARLILNLLAWNGEEGTMLFDEWHHGFRSAASVGPSRWLRSTPGGHAVLFSVFAVFIALILQGRAFGRPIPLRHEIKRRGPMEHVTAIANLSRKAGHRSEVAHQYHHRLKRHLGQRYRLDPSTRDEEYVDMLASYNPAIDKEALLRLLKRLSQPTVNEPELLKLSAEAARWMGK
jgi:hypothetical protein